MSDIIVILVGAALLACLYAFAAYLLVRSERPRRRRWTHGRRS